MKTTTNNIEVAESADIVFLAVKPHILPSVLTEISSAFIYDDNIRHKLFVSVAAGVTISIMEKVGRLSLSFDFVFSNSFFCFKMKYGCDIGL